MMKSMEVKVSHMNIHRKSPICRGWEVFIWVAGNWRITETNILQFQTYWGFCWCWRMHIISRPTRGYHSKSNHWYVIQSSNLMRKQLKFVAWILFSSLLWTYLVGESLFALVLIDVYLQPLIAELKQLSSKDVVTYDISTKQNFILHYSLMWIINKNFCIWDVVWLNDCRKVGLSILYE